VVLGLGSLRAPAIDGAFWRRMARFGARGPEWFARYSPPLIGIVFCALAPEQRAAIARNLRRIRGERPAWRDAADVARTFATYASSLSEVLAGDSPRGRAPSAVVVGENHVWRALQAGRGLIFVTAHTAGWDAAGRLIGRTKGLRMMIVEAPERDARARAIQDEARRGSDVLVAHAGDDPLSALQIVRHLREGGVVALQVDRAPPGLRSREVTLFGERTRVPEGPLRLAGLTGAPIVPIFAARTGHRRYLVSAHPQIDVARSASQAELDVAAQRIADAVQGFVRAHPTQWFHFRDR
jgi:KDO2-lipid IV(A) lauroyltransferase